MFFVFIFNTSKSGHPWKFISPKCLSFLNIVRRNWIFGSGGWTKHNISFESPRRVYYLEKYDDLRNFWTSRFLQTRMDHMNMKFEYFQIQNWMLKTVRTEKVDEKMESFVWFPCSLPELWSWNCLKKWVFYNLMLTSARYLSLLKQFTYKHPKGLVTHFQKMVLFTILWRTVSEILKVWSRQTLLNYCWVSIFFDILTANISWTVAQIPINYIILWKSVMRTFRCIYTSCFNRLRFLLRTAQNCKIWTFLDNLRTTT